MQTYVLVVVLLIQINNSREWIKHFLKRRKYELFNVRSKEVKYFHLLK